MLFGTIFRMSFVEDVNRSGFLKLRSEIVVSNANHIITIIYLMRMSFDR